MIVLFFALAFLLTGCQAKPLAIYSDYVSYKDLASTPIDTPDPRKECPDYGQRLTICWSLPADCISENTELELQVRYSNKEEESFYFILTRPRGRLYFELLNEEYDCKGRLRSYHAKICSRGVLLASWNHQVWMERIKRLKDEG